MRREITIIERKRDYRWELVADERSPPVYEYFIRVNNNFFSPTFFRINIHTDSYYR